MICRDIMNHTIRVCSVDDSIGACAAVLRHPSVSMLMVLDRSQQLVGVLTRDSAIATLSRQRSARAGDAMATDLIYCDPDVESDILAEVLARCVSPVALVAEGETLLGWVDPPTLGAVYHSRLAALPVGDAPILRGLA